MNSQKNVIIVTVALFLLSSCATGNIEKSKIGAVVGAVAGATAGALLMSDNRAAGAAIGTILGGGAGYVLGNMLDERDRASLKAKIDEAANKDSNDKPTIWRSDHSGASASISIGDSPTTIENSMSIPTEFDVTIQPSTLKTVIGKHWATANVNVRAGPGTSYPIKFILREGKETNVIGATDNGWYLIGENDVAVGYVDAYYLQESGSHKKTKQSVSTPKEKSVKVVTQDKETPNLAIKPTKEADVRILRTCKSSKILIKSDDGQVVENLAQICQKPDGSWGS